LKIAIIFNVKVHIIRLLNSLYDMDARTTISLLVEV